MLRATLRVQQGIRIAPNIPQLMPTGFNPIINVKDYGAVGDGSHDDTTAIQNAIDAAFGPAGSPHGSTNVSSNLPLYFPPGNYKVTSTLLFTSVLGGTVFGAGQFSTRIFYAGSVPGSTITSLIQTNGMAYCNFRDMTLAISGTNTVAFNLYWDNTGPVDLTGNSFVSMFFEGQGSPNGTTGVLIPGVIGVSTVGFMGSENSFFECSFANWAHAGLKTFGANALNNNVYQVSLAGCAIGIYCSLGGIPLISGASCANGSPGSNIDFRIDQNPCKIVGVRTETNNCVSCQSWVHMSAVDQQALNAGNYLDLDSSGLGIIDSAQSGLGVIAGSGAAKVYIRGSTFHSATYISGFTGTVGQNI